MSDTISLFEKKKLYKNEVYPTEDAITGLDFPNPVDFWYEKTLYGRVDIQSNVVYISSLEPESLDKFKQFSGRSPEVALNFVVDAFLAFKRDFDKVKALRRLSLDSKISDLDIASAYINPDVLYDAHMNVVMNVFVDTFLLNPKRNEDIENFDDFLRHFVEFCERYAKLIPVTKTAFIKSQYCTPLVSGLVIEIVNEDHNDDNNKGKWINDPNYNFYARTAKKYGFLVDKNAPWRLVANVTSPRMKTFMDPSIPIDYPPGTTSKERKTKYAAIHNLKESYEEVLKNYGSTSPKVLFERHYKKTYLSDIENLQKKLVLMYRKFYQKSPSVKKVKVVRCAGYEFDRLDKLASKVVYRQVPPNNNEITQSYSESYWNELYFLIRLEEEQVSMHKNKFNKIIKNAAALLKAENKFVDKGRSLWYLNEAVRGFPKIVSPEKPTAMTQTTSGVTTPPSDTGGPAPSTGAGLAPGTGGGGIGGMGY